MAKRKRLTPAVGLEIKATNPDQPSGHMGLSSPPIADVAGSAATAAALDDLAHELHSARAQGRLVIKAPLSAIDEGHLVRDRAGLDPDELDVLKASLAARGQQTPIEVVDLGEGRYGLISGWRRLSALKALQAEHPEGGYGHIQCLIRTPETSSHAYIAMVEENEIRAQLSHYERARIAAKACEQGAFETQRGAAKALFGSVPRSKRSKIYSFLEIYNTLDDVLRFPQYLSEREGLALHKALNLEDGILICHALREALKAEQPETQQAERAIIADVLKTHKQSLSPASPEVTDPVKITRKGQVLTLKGPGVDPSLEADLRRWLASRG